MGLLAGRRAVVTGGGSGIGRAVCRRLAAEGAAVAVLDIDGAGAKETTAEVSGVAVDVDVTDAEAMRVAVDDAAAQLGGLSILMNNAGREHHGAAWPTGTPTSGTASSGSTSPGCSTGCAPVSRTSSPAGAGPW